MAATRQVKYTGRGSMAALAKLGGADCHVFSLDDGQAVDICIGPTCYRLWLGDTLNRTSGTYTVLAAKGLSNGTFENRVHISVGPFRAGRSNRTAQRKNVHAVALGRKGGVVKSRAKTSAARANGKLGGRPKKP